MRLVSIAVIIVVLAASAMGQDPPQYSEVRIVVSDRVALGELFEIGEIDHANIDQTDSGLVVEVILGERELELVRAAGYAVEMLVEDVVAEIEQRSVGCPTMPSGTPQGFFFGSMHCFPTLSEAENALDEMHFQYPNLITEKVSIGQSWEGREIWMVRITAADDPEAVPEGLYTSLHHAREPASLTSVLYFMYYLLENYGIDEEVTELLENRALYFIPVVNPDGYRYVETTNLMWRKNRRNNGGSFGVDLNRNYGYQWGGAGSSGNPSHQTYRGPSPFSEPETQALRAWLQTRYIRASYNYHTHGQWWLHPFGYAKYTYTPDHQHFTQLSAEITRYNNYVYGTGADLLYVASGISDDWMYGEQFEKGKIFAWTPEMGTAFWPSTSQIVPISAQALHPNLVLAHAVGPYLSVEEVEIAEAGEGNGYLDPGEEGVVHLSVFNLGLTVDNDARARVVSTNSELGIENSEWSVPFTLTSFDSVELPPLYFDLGADAPLGLHDGLVVEIETDGTLTTVPLHPIEIGTPVVVFEDEINASASNWTLGGWGVTTDNYSPPYALADSPGSNYPNNADNPLTLEVPLDLFEAEVPILRFMAKWDIQPTFDFVQVLASTDGSSWLPLRGYYMTNGSDQGAQPFLEPGYDGTSDGWVQEAISLDAFAGEAEVHLMWRLRSNGSITAAGFFLDDVEVVTMTDGGTVSSEPIVEEYRFGLDAPYPNPVADQAHLRFSLETPGEVTLAVYDMLGRTVRTLSDGTYSAGSHQLVWDGRDAAGRLVASGTYVLVLRGESGQATRRVAVVR